MNDRSRLRNLAFGHPDFDRVGTPGFRVDDRGRLALLEGRAAVRQSLLLLLSTRRGERVMRPDYGCDLHRVAFMPTDDTTAGLALHYVRRAIERWADSVEILDLDAQPGAEAAPSLHIRLRYRLRATGETDELNHRVTMAGEVGP